MSTLGSLSRRALAGALLVLPACAVPASAQEAARPPLRAGDPRRWEPYFDEGVRIFKQSPIDAERHFYWASRLDPTRAEPLFARYAAFFSYTHPEDVVAYFRADAGIQRRPDILAADSLRTRALMRNPFVHRGLELLVFDRLPGNLSDGRDVRAWIAYSNGEMPKAVELLTRTIERGRTGAHWRRLDRALAYVAMGGNRNALADLRKLLEELRAQDDRGAVTFYQSKHFLLYMIGMLHQSMREYDAARTAFQESLVEDASFAYGNAGLAALSRVQRNNAQAEGEYALAVELAPDDGVLRLWHAQVLFDLQRHGDAEAELTRAMALEPYWPAPLHLLGRVRERQGRMDEAFDAWEKYLAMAPAGDQVAKTLRIRVDARPPRAP